jgi:hypothetical protein
MFQSLCARYALTGTLMLGAAVPALTQAAADSTLFTTYNVSTDLQSAQWGVCGSTAQSEGCYSFGNIGPFGHIGSMLEGEPVVNGNTVTRDVYILDIASGTAANGVTLSVYSKTDVVSSSYDQVTMTLQRTISLPLVGGSTVTGYMAANSSALFIGTNQSTQAVEVSKGQWAVTSVGGFSPPLTVAAIGADINGFVTVTFGTPGGQFSGFYVFGPTGALQEDGGGSNIMINHVNGVTPTPLPF